MTQMDRLFANRAKDDFFGSRRSHGMDSMAPLAFNRDLDSFLAQQRAAATPQRPVYQTGTRRPFTGRESVADTSSGNKVTQKSPVKMTPERKDLQPKILKRDPNQITLAQKLKSNDDAIIGLKHVEEVITEHADGTKTYCYECELCNLKDMHSEKLLSHVVSNAHRKAYIKKYNLEEVDDKQLEKRTEAINAVHGRGEWSVRTVEASGLRTFDKSHLFVKKSKPSKNVEMIDISQDKRDALKDGDVVVEELIIDDDENPRLFVFKQIDALMDADFCITNEEEASVLDSLVQKMDGALAEYARKFGTNDEHKGKNTGKCVGKGT